MESDVADRQRAPWQLLLRQSTQHPGPAHRQQEHGTGDAPIKINAATVQILKLPAMIDPGIYPKPIPFGGLQAGPLIVPPRHCWPRDAVGGDQQQGNGHRRKVQHLGA